MNLIFYAFLVNILGVAILNSSGMSPLVAMAAAWMIQAGMMKVDPDNPRFKRIYNLYYVSMGLNLVVFLMSFFNIAVLTTLIGLFISGFEIYLTYHLIRGIQLYADRFKDEKLTDRLFKRWRLSMAFVVLIIVSSVVLFGLSLMSVSINTMIEVFQTIGTATADQSATLMENYVALYPSFMSNMSLWVMGLFLFGLPAIFFEVLFLVSFYKVQKDFQPLDQNPSAE